MTKTPTILTLFLLLFSYSQAQESVELSLSLSNRVDKANTEVMAVVDLYKNYFESKPDSIYDNPYWNTAEKNKYDDFDFSRQSIFQGGMDAPTLFKYFTPFVMSVEPIGDKYQIRVMYSNNATDEKYVGSKVWCIHKLNAVKENDKWVLENLMVELTEKWNNKTVGHINYIYPPSHRFDVDEAQEAREFCDKIIGRFNPAYNEQFKYYLTSSIDDMGLLENFDYYFVGMTTGIAKKAMILSAKGNENYPHEFVHKLLPVNEKRGKVIDEGLAVFLGTKENESQYREDLSKLASDLANDSEKINFESVMSQKVRFNGYQTAYPAGAALCELVHSKKGDQGLINLIHSDTSDTEKIIKSISKITGLDRKEIESEWTKILNSYGVKNE